MLILVLAILLVAAAITYVKYGSSTETFDVNFAGAPGVVAEAWIPWALIAFALLLVALWLLSKLFSIPKAMSRGNAARDAARSREALDNGLLDLSAGEHQKAEATLTSHLDGGPGDAPKFLAAAKAAESRGAHEQADHYLKKASDSSNDASVAVRTTQAEMMIGRGQYDKAETLLTNLHHAMPKNTHVMGLLAGVLQQTGNSGKLASLSQVMRKSDFPADVVAGIEAPAWENTLNKADNADLIKTWDSLPADAKTAPDAVAAYARRLLDTGDHDKAEAVVQKAVNSNFSDKLAGVYGDIESSNVAKQLDNAERWAKTNSTSAALAATIGKLSAKREIWGKARDSLVKSAQLDLTPDVCNELGDVLEAMGESTKAKECFKNAALLASGKAPTGLMADLPNLASKLAEAVGNKASAVARKAS